MQLWKHQENEDHGSSQVHCQYVTNMHTGQLV